MDGLFLNELHLEGQKMIHSIKKWADWTSYPMSTPAPFVKVTTYNVKKRKAQIDGWFQADMEFVTCTTGMPV